MITEKTAKIITEIPGPKSKELLKEREMYVARGVSCAAPVFVDEAKGALIKDIDGNVFVDFVGGIGVQNIGHCDDNVIAAVKEQIDKYISPCFHVNMYEPYVAYAKMLASKVPGSSPKKVMFANSGAEAVENAIKIARKYTGKTGIVTLNGSFHGRTLMTMSLTSKVLPYKDGFGPFAPETYKIPSPYTYRNPLNCSEEDCGKACAEEFNTMLHTTLNPSMIACVIMEPVQGEGGFIVLPKDYVQRMREICTENNIVLVIDEVQAGFARTGKLFAHEHFNVEADLVCMSKSIANGMPISAVAGKAEIMDAPNVGGIGGTFSGNPLSCVAAIKVLEKIEKDNLCQKASELGSKLMERLNGMKSKYSVIGDVRGLGAMIGLEFVKDRATKEPYPEIIKKITSYCLQHGVLLLSAGLLGNVIRFLPPVVMTDEQLTYGMDTLEAAIKEYSR